MKREHLFLEQLSDKQLAHTANIVKREITRRDAEHAAKPARKASRSGQHRAVKG